MDCFAALAMTVSSAFSVLFGPNLVRDRPRFYAMVHLTQQPKEPCAEDEPWTTKAANPAI
jgi:hypothetical protein